MHAIVFYSYTGTDGLVEDEQSFKTEAAAREEYDFRVGHCISVALQIDGVLIVEFHKEA